jgi:hypothetical protein
LRLFLPLVDRVAHVVGDGLAPLREELLRRSDHLRIGLVPNARDALPLLLNLPRRRLLEVRGSTQHRLLCAVRCAPSLLIA